MPRIIDISLPIAPDMVVWPSSAPVVVERTRSFEAGDTHVVSRLACEVHTGTHVDAPLHFVRGGRTVDAMSLDTLVGPCVVADVEAPAITAAVLDQLHLAADTTRLLLRTTNSRWWRDGTRTFQPNFVALTPDGAQWVVDRGIALVGVDYLSVQRFADTEPTTHVVLLSHGVVVIEGLDLTDAQPGRYLLACLPLRITGAEGAPARAVLMPEPSVPSAP